jgi:hypothetical protein
MAKVKLPPFLQEVHGKIGDLVFRSTPNGGTCIYKVPKISRGNTRSAQKLQQHRMRGAHAYAQSAMADPDMKAYYEQEAKKKKIDPYHAALSGYFEVQRKLGE